MLPLCCEVLGGLADLSAQYTLQPCISFFDLRRRKLLLEPHPDLFAPCDEISRLTNLDHRVAAALLTAAASYLVMGVMLGVATVARRLGLPEEEVLEEEKPLVN